MNIIRDLAAITPEQPKPIVTWLACILLLFAVQPGYMFSRAVLWLCFHVFPHWNRLVVFLRLALLCIFPRTAPVTCFPALGTGYMFSRAWHRLHVFPCLTPVTCFSAVGTGYMFSRAWHRLHVFPRLVPVTCFPVLGTGYVFLLRLLIGSLRHLRTL